MMARTTPESGITRRTNTVRVHHKITSLTQQVLLACQDRVTQCQHYHCSNSSAVRVGAHSWVRISSAGQEICMPPVAEIARVLSYSSRRSVLYASITSPQTARAWAATRELKRLEAQSYSIRPSARRCALRSPAASSACVLGSGQPKCPCSFDPAIALESTCRPALLNAFS